MIDRLLFLATRHINLADQMVSDRKRGIQPQRLCQALERLRMPALEVISQAGRCQENRRCRFELSDAVELRAGFIEASERREQMDGIPVPGNNILWIRGDGFFEVVLRLV